MKKNTFYKWLSFLVIEVMLLVLVGFCSVWVAFGSSSNVMFQAGAQRMRVERVAKDVLILAYRPTGLTQAQAMSEIEDTLPAWQEVQTGLTTGDSALNLPEHPPSDINALMQLSQIDYVPIVVALSSIVKHPTPIDPVQVQIVLSHENNYLNTMSRVNLAWQSHIDDMFHQLFWIEAALIAVLFMVEIITFWFVFPHSKRGERIAPSD
jgi:hypothetical protein